MGTYLIISGCVLFALGSGPLLVWMALDPTANPVGPGILAFLTFWPSVLLVVAGIVTVIVGRVLSR